MLAQRIYSSTRHFIITQNLRFGARPTAPSPSFGVFCLLPALSPIVFQHLHPFRGLWTDWRLPGHRFLHQTRRSPHIIDQIHHPDFDFGASHTNGAQQLSPEFTCLHSFGCMCCRGTVILNPYAVFHYVQRVFELPIIIAANTRS